MQSKLCSICCWRSKCQCHWTSTIIINIVTLPSLRNLLILSPVMCTLFYLQWCAHYSISSDVHIILSPVMCTLFYFQWCAHYSISSDVHIKRSESFYSSVNRNLWTVNTSKQNTSEQWTPVNRTPVNRTPANIREQKLVNSEHQ